MVSITSGFNRYFGNYYYWFFNGERVDRVADGSAGFEGRQRRFIYFCPSSYRLGRRTDPRVLCPRLTGSSVRGVFQSEQYEYKSLDQKNTTRRGGAGEREREQKKFISSAACLIS